MVAKDVFPMDIGNGVYTEYTFDANIMKAYDENPELMDCKIGHIHSHHSMATFFSGTDTDELRTNATNYNYYLSLIVNNKMEMTAKLAIPGTFTGRVEYKDNEGNTYTVDAEPENVIKVMNVDIYPFGLDVIMVEERIEELLDKKNAVSTIFTYGGRQESSAPGIYTRDSREEPQLEFAFTRDSRDIHEFTRSGEGENSAAYPPTKFAGTSYESLRNSISWMSTDLFIRRLFTCNPGETPVGNETLRQFLMRMERVAGFFSDVEEDIFEEGLKDNYDKIFESVYGDKTSKVFQAAAMDLAYEWIDKQASISEMAISVCSVLDIVGNVKKLPRKFEVL